MRKRLLFVICAVMASLLTSTAFADVIGSYTLKTGMNSSRTWDWTCNLTIAREPLVWHRTTLLNGDDAGDFEGWTGTDISSNIGRTLWLSSDQDDPDYSRFVSQLTDGIGDCVMIGVMTEGTGFAHPVPLNELLGIPRRYDYPYNEQYDYPYLQGYTIDRIGLSVDSASYIYDHTATYPHIYNWQLTLTIEGSPPVPEPTSLTTLIAGIGGLGVGFCRRSGCLTSKTDKSAR